MLSSNWQKGRLLPGDNKQVLQEYFCFGCSHACRLNIPVREPAPTDCAHPDILKEKQQAADDAGMLFGGRNF